MIAVCKCTEPEKALNSPSCVIRKRMPASHDGDIKLCVEHTRDHESGSLEAYG